MARTFGSIVGTFFFAIALVMSLPGVSAVRADTTAGNPEVVVQGPMCSADQQRQSVGTRAAFEELAARMRARAEADANGAPARIQHLNTQGYNYRNSDTRDVDPTRVAREYQLQREHGHR